MEKLLEPEAFDLPAKNPSVEAQRRWRDAVSFVRNRRRRFRYAPNLEKREEAKELMEKTRVCYYFYILLLLRLRLLLFCFCFRENTPENEHENENESKNREKNEEDLLLSFSTCSSLFVFRENMPENELVKENCEKS